MGERVKVNYSEVSRKTGLSVSHISRIFGGSRNPSIDSLILIAEALNLSVGKLVKILEERPAQ